MTITRYDHWRDVPQDAWRWPDFSPEEIDCRGAGRLLVNEPALDAQQALRDRLGKPLLVRSTYRSSEHNRAVGRTSRSKHMDGAVFDVAMANHDPHAFEAAARASGFHGFGFYREPRHDLMHIDLGPKRERGRRWPAIAPAFASEAPAPKPLAESRTMKGGGTAGLATVGAAGVEVLQDAAVETQAALQPLIPFWTRCACSSSPAALAGIAVALYARWINWTRGRR